MATRTCLWNRRATLSVALCLIAGAVAALTGWTAPLTLPDAIAAGLASHPDIARASHDLRKAELELRAAQARVTLPSVQLELRPFTLGQGSPFPGTTQGSLSFGLGLTTGTNLSLVLNPSYVWDVGDINLNWSFSVSQRFDPVRPTASEARSIMDAYTQLARSAAASAETRADVVLGIVESYTSILASEAALAERQRTLERAERTLAAVQEDMAEGQAGELQRLDAEIAVRDAQIALRRRATSHTAALEQFTRSIGLAGASELTGLGNVAPALFDETEVLLAHEISNDSLARSTTVHSAKDAVSAAEDRLRSMALSAWPIPSVSLTWSDGTWRIGFSLSSALFSPDRAMQREIAKAELERAQDRLSAAWDEAERFILQARAHLEEAHEAVLLMELESEKLTLERAAAEIRLEAGLIGPTDWDTFLRKEERFASDYEQSLLRLLQAYLRYQRALGNELDWEEMVQ